MQHDANGDGRLAATEWPAPDAWPAEQDADRDGLLAVEELAQYIAQYGTHRRIRLMPATFGGALPLPSLLRPGESENPQLGEASGPEMVEAADEATDAEPSAAPADREAEQDHLRDRKYFVLPSRLPAGLPDWFRKGDRDGDGQVTLAEYAAVGSPSADKEFARLDRNRDGLITPREVLGRPVTPKPAVPESVAAAKEVPAASDAEPAKEDHGQPPKADSGQPATASGGDASKADSGESPKADSAQPPTASGGEPPKADSAPAADAGDGATGRSSRRRRDS